MIEHILFTLTGIITVIAGGGWFINRNANKRLKEMDVKQARLDVYIRMIDDMTLRIDKLQNRVLELENKCENCKYKKTLTH